MEFPEAPGLVRNALAVSPRIARLKQRAKAAGWPVIYANDHHGDWRSSFGHVVAQCSADGMRGAGLARALAPEPDDYHVLKPEQSAFHGTPMDRLLQDLAVSRLVLCGIAGDGCVLATAIDARMRGFEVRVPSDCSASATMARHRRALALMRDAMRINTVPSRSLRVV